MFDIDNILGNKKTKKSKSKDPLASLFNNKPKKDTLSSLMVNPKKTIIGDRITKNQKKVFKKAKKSKNMLHLFGDWDGDGVINALDCEPKNKHKHRANKMIRDRLRKVNFEMTNYPTAQNPNQGLQGKRLRYDNINSEKGRVFQNTVKKYPGVLSQMEREYPKIPRVSPAIRYDDTTDTQAKGSYDNWNDGTKVYRNFSTYKPETRAEILYHEMRHKEQAKDIPRSDYDDKYYMQSQKYGYKDNEFEKDARQESSRKVVEQKYGNLPDNMKDNMTKEYADLQLENEGIRQRTKAVLNQRASEYEKKAQAENIKKGLERMED